jgi:non-ribosomal peptide synthetase component F
VEGVLLDAAGLREVRALARAKGATLFVTLLAAFHALLYRYTLQQDVPVTGLAPGRAALTLWGDLSGDPSFRELLGRVRRAVCEGPPPGGNGEALRSRFQFSFPAAAPREGLPREADVRLCVRRAPRGLAASLAHNAALLDAAAAGRILGHLRTLLEAAARDPDRPVSLLPLLPDEERRLLLHDWALRRVDYPKHFCIHQLIEAQAARTPDAPAVVYEMATLSYRELDRRAGRLARWRARRPPAGRPPADRGQPVRHLLHVRDDRRAEGRPGAPPGLLPPALVARPRPRAGAVRPGVADVVDQLRRFPGGAVPAAPRRGHGGPRPPRGLQGHRLPVAGDRPPRGHRVRPVPSVLRLLLRRLKEQGPEARRSLRHIFSHGEALPPDLQALLVSHLRADLHK